MAGGTPVPAVPALCVALSPLLCLPPVPRPCAWGHNGQQCLPCSRLCVTVNSGASFCEFSAQHGARGWTGLVHAGGEPSLLSAPGWWLQSGSRWLPLGFCRATRPHVCTPHASVVSLLLAPVKFFSDVVVPSTLHQQRPGGCCPAALATPGASVLFPLVRDTRQFATYFSIELLVFFVFFPTRASDAGYLALVSGAARTASQPPYAVRRLF